MNVLIVSLNGVQELSGGGLYLRSIVSAFAGLNCLKDLTVISKGVGEQSVALPEGARYVYLHKTVWSDIVSRAMLNPTFLGTNLGVIVQHAKQADLIVLHNSRCGRILASLKRRFPQKKFGIISDNSEYDLRRQHEAFGVLRRIERTIDVHEIYAAEQRCLQADFISFITRKDREVYAARYGQPRVYSVLPITVEPGVSTVGSDRAGPVRAIFTGHFGFAPNVGALETLAYVAARYSAGVNFPVVFAAAGAGVERCSEAGGQIEKLESPSAAQMQSFFRDASVYLAPVSWGSGMKTKVAEALSYGLPVICLPNAAEGYEDVLSSNRHACVIEVVQSGDQMVDALERLLVDPEELVRRRQLALEAFGLYLSPESQRRRVQALMDTIGLARHTGQSSR